VVEKALLYRLLRILQNSLEMLYGQSIKLAVIVELNISMNKDRVAVSLLIELGTFQPKHRLN
jgi:hypothetical protein